MVKSGALRRIFSIQDSSLKTHKILNFCGLRFKFRCDGNRKGYRQLLGGIRDNSVLIVEINNCHYEVIPGYVEYFIELGYNVDVATPSDAQLDFLTDAITSVRIFRLGKRNMERLLKSEDIRKYKYILFSSAIKYVDGFAANSPEMPFVTEYYRDIAADQRRLIFVQHHMERQGVNKNQIALADLHNQYSANFYIVNPHYFGKIKITPKNENITNFIVVGGISSWRKNYNLLLEAVRKLAQSGKKFKVTLVGSGNKLDIDDGISPYLDVRGRLSYPDMFRAMEEADFFLCLLDPDNPDHDRYITMGTSGSFQLIYGFVKPCLIQKKFAAVYEFNPLNSLVYEKNDDLAQTMEKAIDMPGKEYKVMQRELSQKVSFIHQRSLKNMKLMLEAIDINCEV